MTTDSAGFYRVRGLKEGVYVAIVGKIGFLPATDTLVVEPDVLTSWDVSLDPAPTLLDSVQVRADATVPQRYGSNSRLGEFYSRRERGRGRFLSRDDIESSGTYDFGSLLRRIPGLRVSSISGGGLAVTMARCATPASLGSGSGAPPSVGGAITLVEADAPMPQLAVFLDGARVHKRGINEILGSIKLDNVEAIEVYRGPSELPAEATGDACAAIYIWSRFGATDRSTSAAVEP